MASGKSNSLI